MPVPVPVPLLKFLYLPQWTAPEILRGQPHDESADTYSFGVLLYEIMSRKLPYAGVDTFQVSRDAHERGLYGGPKPERSPLALTLSPSRW